MHGENVEGGAYNAKRTPCSHKDIDYLPKCQGLGKNEVDSLIMPVLMAAGASRLL